MLPNVQANPLSVNDGRPSSVKEWEYFNNLDEGTKQQYINMKRANSFKIQDINGAPTVIDRGANGQINVNPLSTAKDTNQAAVNAENALAMGQDQTKKNIEQPQDYARFQEALEDVDKYEALIKRLINHKGRTTATGFQSMFPTTSGSDSASFESDLDTLKAKNFIGSLMKLKRNSPNGSTGLGGLNEQLASRI